MADSPEMRAITGAAALICGLAAAGSIWPVVDRAVSVVVVALLALGVLVAVGRWAWAAWLLRCELTRPIPTRPTAPAWPAAREEIRR